MNEQDSRSKITIGVPVYNGEKTIRRALDSLLNQTYRNFELIISDNASIDSTSKICMEYEQKDERIRYLRKDKTVSVTSNFFSLIEQAETKYFMFASDDDFWDPQFIEKNLEVLENNHNVVGSISDIKLVGKNITNYYSDSDIHDSNNLKWEFVRPYIGTYEKKVNDILEFNWICNQFSVFRTEELKKSIIKKRFASWDFASMLNVIKFGDLYVLDETLMFRDTGGISSTKSEIELMKKQNFGWIGTYFPYIRYTIWCMKNLGLQIFLKHISHFKYLNIHSCKKIAKELFYKIKK